MSLQTRLSALITAMKGETNAQRTLLTGSSTGDLSALTTDTTTNMVAALNSTEAKAAAAVAGGLQIDDANPASTTTVYSGAKVESALTAGIAAALEGEDLSELAAAVAANAAADANLATAASVATLSATVANKANTSDIYTKAELGDPETDLVALWNAA